MTNEELLEEINKLREEIGDNKKRIEGFEARMFGATSLSGRAIGLYDKVSSESSEANTAVYHITHLLQVLAYNINNRLGELERGVDQEADEEDEQ